MNLCLIVESFVSFNQVYLCCYSDCDPPTEFSRSDLLSHTHLHWVCAFRDLNSGRLTVSRSTDQLSSQQVSSYSQSKPISRTTSTSLESQPSISTSKSILKATFCVGLKSIQSNKTFRARLLAALNRATREG